jgi:hypothetical protein
LVEHARRLEFAGNAELGKRLDSTARDVSPASRTRPAFGRTMPDSMLKSVLLPAPFGPMMHVDPVSATPKLTPSTATTPPK